MKKFYSLFAFLMLTCISTSAQETWLVDGTEYFFQNVATNYWLGPGNSWGTQASVMRYPQNFKAVKVSEGVYKFDSHIYNGANNHFLGDGYTDNGGDQWNVIAAGDGTYYLKAISGNYKNKYISSEEAGKAVTFLEATTENSKWVIYSYDAVAARMAEATVDNPVKITELIESNTFSRNSVTDYYKPWARTGFDGKDDPKNSAIGGNDYACAESYHSENGFKFAQTIDTCVVPGVYVLDAQAFYRQDGSDIENMPYIAVDGNKTYFPERTGSENNMAEAYASFLEKKYPVKSLYFGVGEGSKKLEIEIASNNKGMWHIFGELELSYLGNGADAFQKWLDGFIAAKPDYSGIEYKTGDIYSVYEFALEDYSTGSTYDEVKDAMNIINTAEDTLKVNIAAWNALIEARDDAYNNVVNNEKIVGPDKDVLGDYITVTINGSVLNEKSASNEELAAYTAEIKRLQAIAVENGMEAGTDVTYMLKNPNMTENGGWEGSPAIDIKAHCAERWNGGAFDVYQVVEGAPVGIYEISLQGFYRPARGDQSYGFYFNKDGSRKDPPEFGDWKENKAYIYMNDAQTLLDVVWNYGQTRDNLTYDLTERANKPYAAVAGNDTTWYCNDMGDAGKAFDQGAYKVSAYGLVAEKGDVMRLGVKGNNYNADNWAIFTRFKLTYQRYDETVMSKFLATEIEKAEATLSQLFGYDKRQALTQAIADAKAATEGEAMFTALKTLVAIEKELTTSIAKFDTLKTKMEDLDVALNNYEAIAREEALEEAGGFLDDVLVPSLPPTVKAEDVTLTDSVAVRYIKTIDELIAALKIPAKTGSDDDPADYTSMINNYNYSSGDGTGWTRNNIKGNNNYNYNAAEYYQGVYNHYQDIKNLPAGTYMVSNQGFYRWTSQQEDFDSVRAEVPSLASMYVMVFTENSDSTESNARDSIACPIRYLTTEAVNSNPDIDGQTNVALFSKDYDDTPWYMPNNMQSFSLWVKGNKEDYKNKIIVKVAEGQTLRIGMSQSESVSGGWAIFTNWALEAYGPESKKEEGVLTSSYANYKPTLDSVRASVRKPLNDIIVVADSVYKTMEEGEAKEALELAITSAKEVYNTNTSSNDDVTAATNALNDALGGGGYKQGDVNRDGKVDIGDLISVSNFMAGEGGTVTFDDADVNKDKKVDIGDIITIANIMAGNNE